MGKSSGWVPPGGVAALRVPPIPEFSSLRTSNSVKTKRHHHHPRRAAPAPAAVCGSSMVSQRFPIRRNCLQDTPRAGSGDPGRTLKPQSKPHHPPPPTAVGQTKQTGRLGRLGEVRTGKAVRGTHGIRLVWRISSTAVFSVLPCPQRFSTVKILVQKWYQNRTSEGLFRGFRKSVESRSFCEKPSVFPSKLNPDRNRSKVLLLTLNQ